MKKILYIIALMAVIVPSTCLFSACACSFLGANTYTVTFVDWDDTVIDEQTVNSGENAVPPASPTRTGYTFDSWEGDYENVISNVTIKAKYNINTYTVTFKDYNDTVLSTQTVDYGEGATAPVNPTREGYTFTDWDKSFNNVTNNITVNAVYEEIISIVGSWKTEALGLNITEENPEGDVFLVGEDTGEVVLTEYYFYVTFTETQATINHLENEYIVNYSKDNNMFITEEISEISASYQFTLNQEGKLKVEISLVDGIANGYILLIEGAPVIPETFTVTFKDWDGSILYTQTVNSGSAATAPTSPTRTGYTFTGWDPADFTNITANTTITAQYTQNAQASFTVYFVDYDGTTVLKTETVEAGQAATAPADPTRTGYTFTGWSPADFTNITADTTITATYTEDITTFTVTFKDWDGTTLDEQTVNSGSAATAPADPTRIGYTFTGWDPADFTNITADITITATYTQDVADNIIGTWANGASYTSETYETTEGDISAYSFTFDANGTLSCTLAEAYTGTWVKDGENYSLTWNADTSTATATIIGNDIRISDGTTFWWRFTKSI